jgi:hypothetical protein
MMRHADDYSSVRNEKELEEPRGGEELEMQGSPPGGSDQNIPTTLTPSDSVVTIGNAA